MSIALLFPGQGAQHPGMLAGLPTTPAAAGTLARAREALPMPLSELDSTAVLRSTTHAQLALVVAGVATARALIDDQGLPVAAVAGHSVGAFGAAVIAGVLDLEDALRAVTVRGGHMEAACAGGSWGMAALRGLGEAAAARLVAEVATRTEPLWIANVNAADQTVVSGTVVALDRLGDRAARAGARGLIRLEITVASHCPLQAGTARAVAEALAGTEPGRQRMAYFTNTTGRRVVDDPRKVIDDLAQAVRQPVRWYDIARLMPEVGVTATVEVPPGHVLTALGAKEGTLGVAVEQAGIDATLRRATKS